MGLSLSHFYFNNVLVQQRRSGDDGDIGHSALRYFQLSFLKKIQSKMDLDGWARPSLCMIIHGPLASQTKKNHRDVQWADDGTRSLTKRPRLCMFIRLYHNIVIFLHYCSILFLNTQKNAC
jgi:hypothetical protein